MRRRLGDRLGVLVGVTVTIVAALAVIAVASAQQAGGILNVCINQATGAVRFVNGGASPAGAGMNRGCAAAEQAASWSMLGPTGVNPMGAATWSWLANTYWYVPAAYLPAYAFNADRSELLPIVDQTVYHITEYRLGYFWGETAVQLGPTGSPSCLQLVGSVTPEGTLYLTFTPNDPRQNTTITVGTGQMRSSMGQWTMENQMSSGPGVRLQILHWAYMAQGQPNQIVPGVGTTIDQFLKQCPPGPRPVVP